MDIVKLIRNARTNDASDLHCVVASPPLIRVRGSLEPLDGQSSLSAEDINEAFTQLPTPEERRAFHQQLELDFGYSLSGIGRLRCNAAQQRGAISLAIRLLPPKIPSIDELELPQICKKLIMQPRGLILVTGPTGSGKSTTLAAMIQHLNDNKSQHVITIEDPIEYVHPSIKCAITQRQLGSDTLSFPQALKHILRQNPDVILVGEMRDTDTAAAVLNIAETGHLVLSTGHAPSAHQALERIIDLFPPYERHLAQTRLASLLVAVLCQTLVPRADGSGRKAAVEVMLANGAVKSLIREGKIYQLPNVIRTNRKLGMISMDESLVNLYREATINYETLMSKCNDRVEVGKMLGLDVSKKKDAVEK